VGILVLSVVVLLILLVTTNRSSSNLLRKLNELEKAPICKLKDHVEMLESKQAIMEGQLGLLLVGGDKYSYDTYPRFAETTAKKYMLSSIYQVWTAYPRFEYTDAQYECFTCTYSKAKKTNTFYLG